MINKNQKAFNQRNYYSRNREECKKRMRYYYSKNKEKFRKKGNEWYQKNKESFKKYLKKHYIENRDEYISKQKEYYKNNLDKIKKYRKEYGIKNKEKRKKYLKEYRFKLKKKLIDHYSNGNNKCANCGLNDFKNLTIDHIDGDGGLHRKIVSAGKFYTWLIKNNFPEGYQVLCFGCNLEKGGGNRV